MSVGDGLPVFVREGVEHGVVGVDAGQSVPFQLVGHHRYKHLHPSRVVSPVANNLKWNISMSISQSFQSCKKNILFKHILPITGFDPHYFALLKTKDFLKNM